MIWLYNLAWVIAIGLGSPFWIIWVLGSPKRRRDLVQRFRPLPQLPADSKGRIWIHAASVGEAEAIVPLVKELDGAGESLLLTTTSTTGRDRLRAHFRGIPVCLAPLDAPGLIHLSVRRVQPRILVLVETELWPNLIRAAAARGARIVLLSGRISDRSYPRYRWLKVLVGDILSKFDAIAARSEEDAERFLNLGASAERVMVLGDLKLDRPPAPPPAGELERAIGPGPFLIGGSTHVGEEELLLSVWKELRDGPAPNLRLLLVPRHPERVADVCASARRYGVEFGLRSSGAATVGVVVVDSIGELASLYHLAELVFCGGTLANVGGHNLFEPVQAGKVVVHGPHTRNQRHQVQLLKPLGVLHEVQDAGGLRRTLFGLWQDPERNAPARAASAFFAGNRGATQRAVALLTALEMRHG